MSRLVQILFPRKHFDRNGISINDIKLLLDSLPAYSKLITVMECFWKDVLIWRIHNDGFKNIPDGQILPEVVANYKNGKFEIDLSSHYDNINICQHQFVPYFGLQETYEYCVTCGIRK